MNTLVTFVLDRVKSVVSKKVGATLLAESAVAATNPSLQGVPLMVYIVVQGALDGFKYWVDSRNSTTRM